ncbi:MAG: LacI family DNA-binding transcriptional regulator [Hyphomonadaceae bacterium]|nr:LacI family DNA-binding transcriptional regulator [Hyphomonadaceae bacterium]
MARRAQTNGRRAREVVTINDVARHVGVSPMTVSRVVNGEKYVREETRKAVMAAVRALNYAPNQAARSLAGAEGLRIGLLYGNPSAAYLGEFLLGALDQSGRKSAQLVLEKCDAADAKAERAIVRRLLAGGADGVILPPPLCEHANVHALLTEKNVPAVAVSPGLPLAHCACVRINDYKAAYELTTHLISYGHTRIAFIKGHPDQTASAERLRGFEDAMRDANLEIQKPLVVQGFFTFRSGLEGAEKLLARPKPPTAIFASNDDMAAGAISAAHRRGLDVPRDLSVVGFDDTPILAAVWPAVTTIRQPVAQMAEIAVDLLFRDVQGRKKTGHAPPPVDRVVEHSLVKRDSVARPKR